MSYSNHRDSIFTSIIGHCPFGSDLVFKARSRGYTWRAAAAATPFGTMWLTMCRWSYQSPREPMRSTRLIISSSRWECHPGPKGGYRLLRFILRITPNIPISHTERIFSYSIRREIAMSQQSHSAPLSSGSSILLHIQAICLAILYPKV